MQTEGLKQGLLSGLPSGIYIAMGSPVGRARHSETEMRKGIISLEAPRAALGCGSRVIRWQLLDFGSKFLEETMKKMWDN